MTIPASASGTTPNVTTGIASAFAIGDTSETCWKIASVPGTRPMVTSACVRAAARSSITARAARVGAGAGRSLPTWAYSRSPTAPNDSQNPGENPAHGSQTSTAASAHSHTTQAVPGRASHRPNAATCSINSVRTAGTCAPASST